MNGPAGTLPRDGGGFERLLRFKPRQLAGERCELCSAPIGNKHQHLLETAAEKILCCCGSCSLLFGNHHGSKYKPIPRNARRLSGFELTDAQWDSFAIPIGLAFFFRRSAAGKVVAFYPSPAGATESLLDLGAWNDLESANTVLSQMQPDVEALLVNRIGEAREYYIAPVDKCYELSGVIRANWRGLSGGKEVWAKISVFFRELTNESVPV